MWDHHPDMVEKKNFEVIPTSSITIQGEPPTVAETEVS